MCLDNVLPSVGPAPGLAWMETAGQLVGRSLDGLSRDYSTARTVPEHVDATRVVSRFLEGRVLIWKLWSEYPGTPSPTLVPATIGRNGPLVRSVPATHILSLKL